MRFTFVLLLFGCESGPYQSVDGDGGLIDEQDAGPSAIDLVVDTNRDGRLTAEDDEGQETWDAAHGAIFLANRDADGMPGPGLDRTPDAADEVVNGAEDLLDLARFRIAPWPAAPAETVASLAIDVDAASRVRVFRLRGTEWAPVAFPLELGSGSIHEGVELAIEGLDFLLDGAWDGRVTFTLTVRDGVGQTIHEERAVMREAPVLLSWNTQPTNTVFVSDVGGQDNQRFIDAIVETAEPLGIEPYVIDAYFPLYVDAGVGDQWTQDFFEVGAAYLPIEGGGWHRMAVGIRLKPPMPSGLFVENELYGADYAFVEEFGDLRDYDPYSYGASLDYGGNLEMVPPHDGYPAGRILIGRTEDRYPHPVYFDFLQAQYAQTPALEVDTQWLIVGHVDEIMGFVQAPGTERGWKMTLGSPREAWEMLEDLVAEDPANADLVMFEGKYWADFYYGGNGELAETTVGEVLADADLAAANDVAQEHADEIHDLLVAEVGITEDDIVYLPYLWEESGFGGFVAYQPGLANLVFYDGVALVAKPFGPIVDGDDPFEAITRERLEPLGIDVRFVDDWNLYHRLEGEVHCGSNVDRTMPDDVDWWEMDR